MFVCLFRLMIMMSSSAFAGSSPTVQPQFVHFPACNAVNSPSDAENPNPPKCEPYKNPARIASPMWAVRMSNDVATALRVCKPTVKKEIDETIAARDNLLGCLDDPHKNQGKRCQNLIAALRVQLTSQVRVLRIALALAYVPEGLEPSTPYIGKEVRLPAHFGGKFLEPLNSIELLFARTYVEATLSADALKDYDGNVLNVDNAGVQIDRAVFEKACLADLYKKCELYQVYKDTQMAHLRITMAQIANRAIDALPMAAQFDKLPISDSDLERELKKSRDAVLKWSKEIDTADDDGSTLLLGYPDVINSCLKDNSNLCKSVEKYVDGLVHSQKFFNYTILATKVAAVGITCYLVGAYPCVALGGTLGAVDVYAAKKADSKKAERYLAQSEQLHIILGSDVYKSHRDLVTTMGLAVAAVVPGVAEEAAGAALALEEATTVTESASFASGVGSGIGKNVATAARDEAVGNVASSKLKVRVPEDDYFGDKTAEQLFVQLAENVPKGP